MPEKKDKSEQQEPKEEIKNKNGKKDVEELKAQVEQEREAKLRALADFDNYKKRKAREDENIRTMTSMHILNAITDVIDDFERMIEDLEEPKEEDQIDAFKPVLDKLKGILADYNVQQIEIEKGDEFDPAKMEAIGTVAVEDKSQEKKIVDIVQRGYILTTNDQVIRHARVIIGKVDDK